MQIEDTEAIYDMESKKLDFEILGVRHEGKSKLEPQMRTPQTSASEIIKKFIVGSYDIRFLCSNMRIEAKRAIYDIE